MCWKCEELNKMQASEDKKLLRVDPKNPRGRLTSKEEMESINFSDNAINAAMKIILGNSKN